MSQEIYAVVYQMGKVASTSLVATLAKLPDVTAVQSHFLGLDALRDVLSTVVSSDLDDYFHKHQFGQLVANIKVTHRINRIMDGKSDARLLMVSLTRDPVDWFRSSLVQDMQAYAPQLLAHAARHALPGDSEDDLIRAALTDLLDRFVAILTSRGGIDAHFTKRKQGLGEGFEGSPLQDQPALQHLFRVMLRPYRWLEDHFERATGVMLSDFDQQGYVFTKTTPRADYIVLRYEDIDDAFIPALAALGLQISPPLERENTSQNKLFAKAARDAFESEAARALSGIASQSHYARRFNY